MAAVGKAGQNSDGSMNVGPWGQQSVSFLRRLIVSLAEERYGCGPQQWRRPGNDV